MSVKFRAERNKWQADVVIGGRRRRILFDKKRDAEEAEKKSKQKRLGLGDQTEIPRVLIGAGFADYYQKESKSRKSTTSAANDKWYFNLANHFFEAHSLEYVDEIGLQHLEDLQRWLGPARLLGTEKIEATGEEREVRKEAWSASTVNRAFHTYDHYFTKMCAWGLLEKNPGQYLKSLPEDPVKRNPMTEEIYNAVMSHKETPAWFKDVQEFIREIGPRGSSIERFEWPMVNFSLKRYQLDTRKGARAVTKLIDLPMTGRMFALLVRVRNKWPAATGAVFRYDTGEPVKAERISKVGNRLIKLCGFDDVHLYGARHGLASDLINAGAEIELVRQLLGHSSTKTTQNYTKGTNMETLGNALKLVRGDRDVTAPDGTNEETPVASGATEETGT